MFASPKPLVPAVLLLCALAAPARAAPDPTPAHPPIASGVEAGPVRELVDAARARPDAIWGRLAAFCDQVGHRLSGSPGYLAAVAWTQAGFSADGQEAVRAEPVQVPVWVRGPERLQLLSPLSRDLALLGLGGTVPAVGLEAPVVVVGSEAELGPQVAGHIVVFDVPMKPDLPAIAEYGATVSVRGGGASKAAAHGAVAALVRSLTARSLYTPHTGALRYDPEQPKIPAAAITPEDAAWLHRLSDAGTPLRMRLDLGAQVLPDVNNPNVIAEVRGGEKADEIVLIGAHLDSWDVGQGAHDDGAGVMEVMEALRLIRERVQRTGERPARTIRAVLFANEENGLRGGVAYAAAWGAQGAGQRHVAAIEADLGGGWPLAWGATGQPEQLAWLRRHAARLGMPVLEGGGGADISPLGPEGVLLVGLRPDDSHYFDVHHTHADTVDKVDPASLAEATGAMAALAWMLADADDL